MPDAFLDSSLSLDIRAALQQVDRLNADLARATTDVRVTADVRQVTLAIDAAVDAADAMLDIAVDTSGVTAEIDAAVEAADSSVLVDVEVDVDDRASDEIDQITSRLNGLTRDQQEIVLRANIRQAEQSLRQIERQLGDESLSNAEVRVLVDQSGEASRRIETLKGQIDLLDADSITISGQVDPALSAGLDDVADSADAAATSGISLRTILAGITVGAAVAAVRQLADAASDLQESSSKAAVVFGAEFEDIEDFATDAATATGLSAQAALEATGTFGNLFQALGTSREEAARLSPEVVQLAADLASFNNLGVDETLEKLRSGLVGEVEPLRSLGVSFLAADVQAKALELGLGDLNGTLTEGEKVQARLALITEQTSLAHGDFGRTSEGLANQQRILRAELDNAAAAAGTALLPALQAIIGEVRDGVPAIQQLGEDVLPAVGNALASLAPLLGTTLDLFVAASPIITVVAEVIAMIPPEALALAGALLTVNKAAGLFSKGADLVTSGIGKMVTGFLAMNPLVLGATLLAAGLFREWQAGRKAAADHAAGVDQVGQSLAGVGTEYDSSRDALEAYTTSLVEGEQATVIFGNSLDNIPVGALFRELGLDAARAADLIAQGPEAVDAFVDSLGDLSQEEAVAVAALRELTSRTKEATEAQLVALGATDSLTVAEERELAALQARSAGVEAYTDLLDRSTARQAEAEIAAQGVIDRYDEQATSALAAGDALANLAENNADAAAIATLVTTAGIEGSAAWLDFALALDAAALSEEDMADMAVALGTDVESLQGFIEAATTAVDDFVTAAVDGLPAISGAFRDANDSGKVSAREFIDGLAEDTILMQTFIADLVTIVDEGFVEVAGVLAEQGVEAAGTVAAQLAGAAREGNRALLLETQAGLDDRDAIIAFSTAYLRDTLGPEYVAVTGDVAALATDAFGAEFDPAEESRIQMEIAGLTLDEEGRKVALIAATVGAEEARRFGEALNLDSRTVTEAVRAGVAIRTNAPHSAFTNTGFGLGEDFADGIVSGMNYRQQRIDDKAAQLALSAAAAARRAAQAESPSRLFARIGVDMVDGMALGLGSDDAVVRAAEAVVADAAAAAMAVAVDPIGLGVSAAAAGAASTGAGGTSVTFAAGSVVVQAAPGMTHEDTVAVGEGIVEGMERRLVERQLAVLGRTT